MLDASEFFKGPSTWVGLMFGRTVFNYHYYNDHYFNMKYLDHL